MNTSRHEPTSKFSFYYTISAALIITVLVLYLIGKFFASFSYIDINSSSKIATDTRIHPVGIITIGDGVPVGERSGERVFQKVCFQCHAADSKTANSPKMTNESEWAPRIAKGKEALIKNAIDGFNTMPVRGGAPDLTDEEIERAIVYMTNNSGGNFQLSDDAQLPEEDGSDAAEAAEETSTEN